MAQWRTLQPSVWEDKKKYFQLHYSTSLKQFGITQVIGKQLCSLTCPLSSLLGLSCFFFFLFFKERAFGWIWTWKRVQQTASGHKRLSHEFMLHQGPSFLLSVKWDWSGIGFFHHLHFQIVNVNSLWAISLTWITLYTCISAYLHEKKIGIHNEVPLDSQDLLDCPRKISSWVSSFKEFYCALI